MTVLSLQDVGDICHVVGHCQPKMAALGHVAFTLLGLGNKTYHTQPMNSLSGFLDTCICGLVSGWLVKCSLSY